MATPSPILPAKNVPLTEEQRAPDGVPLQWFAGDANPYEKADYRIDLRLRPERVSPIVRSARPLAGKGAQREGEEAPPLRTSQ